MYSTFLLLTTAVVITSMFYFRLSKHIGAFAVVYGIFLSFGELGIVPNNPNKYHVNLPIYQGPGNCLGLLAGKSGPTAVRGQYYGVAAAIGKVGAFVGTWGMFMLF